MPNVDIFYANPLDDSLSNVDLQQQALWLSRGLRLGAKARGKRTAFQVTTARAAWNALLRRDQNFRHWNKYVPLRWNRLIIPGNESNAPFVGRGTAALVLEFLRRRHAVVVLWSAPVEPPAAGYQNEYDYVRVVGIDPIEPSDPWLPRRLHLAHAFLPF